MAAASRKPYKSPEGTYKVLLKSFLEDTDLTDAEFRVAAYLATKPEDWVASLTQIARDLNRPPERVRLALRGLRAKGYAKVVEVRGPDRQWKRRPTMLAREKVLVLSESQRVNAT